MFYSNNNICISLTIVGIFDIHLLLHFVTVFCAIEYLFDLKISYLICMFICYCCVIFSLLFVSFCHCIFELCSTMTRDIKYYNCCNI